MSPAWHRRIVKPLIGLLALNAAVFAVFTLPRLLQERSLASREGSLRAEVELERQRTAEARRRVEVLRANGADTARFYQTVVQDRRSGLVPLLQELSATAEGLGLRVQQQSYQRQAMPGLPLERFRITFPLSGSYAQLASFVAALERARRFVTLDQVALSDKGQAGQAALSMVLSAYFRPSDDPAR